MFLTGCRPNEAAYLVLARGPIRKNAYAHGVRSLPSFKGDWMAVMPAAETKTGLDYKWDIPAAANFAVVLLRALHAYAPDLDEELGGRARFTKALKNWFVERVLPDAGYAARDAKEKEPAIPKYNMRSIRCYVGTDWAKRAKEADVAKRPRPPNTLQHADDRTTFRRYAKKSAADNMEAVGRIVRRRNLKVNKKNALKALP